MLDLRHVPKDRAYARLHADTLQVLAVIDDDIAGMATISSFVNRALTTHFDTCGQGSIA